jgi:3-hydroxyacyl-CoA dehydrogenase
MTTPETAVAVERHGDVLVATLNNPPVNALSTAVRQGLVDAVDAAEADPTVRALLLVGQGRDFCAGADIKEFGKPRLPPTLPEVCSRLESCGKLVVAAIRGVALGGGLEVALSAHYRLAAQNARMGLPEVLLGLLPGAGGTQRTPRIIGVAAALDLILSGKQVSAKQALEWGLADKLTAGDDILAEGLAYARELLDAGAAPRPTSRRADALGDRAAAQAALDAARAETAKRSRGLLSPFKILDAVQAALDQPFEEGMKIERAAFLECMDSPQRAGLVHAFFAERETARVPEAKRGQARPFDITGVIGGGTMGTGIAVSLLQAGLKVTLIERDDAALDRARANIGKIYDGFVAKGRVSEATRAETLQRLAYSTDYAALSSADLVIEAVFEDMAVKQAVFAELDRHCKPGAVLATNTSYLDVGALAATTRRPADVIGLHFFSPAHVMKLLEIVVPPAAADDTVATAFALARKLGKVAVRAGICDGFIGNRLLAVYREAADLLMIAGASPYQIDGALRDFGFAMGPYQVIDLAGGDIGWATRKRRAPLRDPAAPYVRVSDLLCERGWFGQKTGRGYYLYPEGSRQGKPDPEVLAIIDEERKRLGVVPREFSNEEIVDYYLCAMINEGADVVREGIALRPLDVDAVLVHGYGFPRHRGGPMHYADRVGLDRILASLRAYAKENPHFWKPSPLIEDLVARGADFNSLNKPEA